MDSDFFLFRIIIIREMHLFEGSTEVPLENLLDAKVSLMAKVQARYSW